MSSTPDPGRPASTLFLTVLGALVVAALLFAGNLALRVEAIDVRLKAQESTTSTLATTKDLARLELKVDRLELKLDQVLSERRDTGGGRK